MSNNFTYLITSQFIMWPHKLHIWDQPSLFLLYIYVIHHIMFHWLLCSLTLEHVSSIVTLLLLSCVCETKPLVVTLWQIALISLFVVSAKVFIQVSGSTVDRWIIYICISSWWSVCVNQSVVVSFPVTSTPLMDLIELSVMEEEEKEEGPPCSVWWRSPG